VEVLTKLKGKLGKLKGHHHQKTKPKASHHSGGCGTALPAPAPVKPKCKSIELILSFHTQFE
jgi:hypothetical protein